MDHLKDLSLIADDIKACVDEHGVDVGIDVFRRQLVLQARLIISECTTYLRHEQNMDFALSSEHSPQSSSYMSREVDAIHALFPLTVLDNSTKEVVFNGFLTIDGIIDANTGMVAIVKGADDLTMGWMFFAAMLIYAARRNSRNGGRYSRNYYHELKWANRELQELLPVVFTLATHPVASQTVGFMVFDQLKNKFSALGDMWGNVSAEQPHLLFQTVFSQMSDN